MNTTTDLRIQKTYLALHNAFTELLETKRFEEFTVNELCTLSMIRRATFYKHFSDKYDYFAFYTREMMEEFRRELPPFSQKSAMEYLTYMSKQLILFMKQHNKMVLNIKNSSVFHMLLSILVDEVSCDVFLALQQSEFGNTLNKAQLKALSAFYVGGISNVLLSSLRPDGSPDEELLASMQGLLCSPNFTTI